MWNGNLDNFEENTIYVSDNDSTASVILGSANEDTHQLPKSRLAFRLAIGRDKAREANKETTGNWIKDQKEFLLKDPDYSLLHDFDASFAKQMCRFVQALDTNYENKIQEVFENNNVDDFAFPLWSHSNRMKIFMSILKIFLGCDRFKIVDDSSSKKRKEILFFFKRFHDSLLIDTWKDSYDATLLMNMVLFNDSDIPTMKNMKFLLESIIQERYFDDIYISHRASFSLKVQFEMQHYLGRTKPGKTKNTVITPGQKILLKTVRIINFGTYEDVRDKRMMPGQQKMISRHPVKLLNEDGTTKERKIMLTCCKRIRAPVLTTHVKRDNKFYTKRGPFKIDSWEVMDDKPFNEVDPEHFDCDSVHTKSSGGATLVTKQNEYKIAESTSTKVVNVPEQQNEDEISPHFYRNTTLLMLAAKTKSWGVVKAILNLPPNEYPSLFEEEGLMKKHPLYHEDDSKANLLYLAIEDEQDEVCAKIIEHVDEYTLRTAAVFDGKTALQFIDEKRRFGGCEEIVDLMDVISEKVKNRKLKFNHKRGSSSWDFDEQFPYARKNRY